MLQKSRRRVEVKGSPSFHPESWSSLPCFCLCRLWICWMLRTSHPIDWLPYRGADSPNKEMCYCIMVIEECWIPKNKEQRQPYGTPLQDKDKPWNWMSGWASIHTFKSLLMLCNHKILYESIYILVLLSIGCYLGCTLVCFTGFLYEVIFKGHINPTMASWAIRPSFIGVGAEPTSICK